MPVNARDFLDLAKQQADGCSSEMVCRSSVRLGYYAAHHHAKTILPSGITADKGRSSHQSVITALLEDSDRRLVAAGHALAHARGLRTRADYELDETITDMHVKTALGSVDNVFEKITECSTSDAS